MRLLPRTILLVAVVPLIPVICRQNWFSALGLDVGDLPTSVCALRDEQSRAEQLETASARLRARLDEEARILSGLIAGDMTLRAAAARVRELRSKQEFEFLVERLRDRGKGGSEDELICRNFLGAVRGIYSLRQIEAAQRGTLEQHEMEKRQVLSRLEQEMAEYLGAAGQDCR
jgi:hypothetical protein